MAKRHSPKEHGTANTRISFFFPCLLVFPRGCNSIPRRPYLCSATVPNSEMQPPPTEHGKRPSQQLEYCSAVFPSGCVRALVSVCFRGVWRPSNRSTFSEAAVLHVLLCLSTLSYPPPPPPPTRSLTLLHLG